MFDLDGTLIDSLADIADACNRVLAARGYPIHGRDAYRYFVGEGVAKLISRVLPAEARNEAIMAACAKEYSAQYARGWNVQTRPYAGIPELLDALAAAGMRMAVLSNKPDEFTLRCVGELLPRWNFDAVVGASARFAHKPDPGAALHIAGEMGIAPEEFLYIGDTATDMQTGKSAGMYPLGVLWGFREADELLAAGARGLVKSPGEVVRWCDRVR